MCLARERTAAYVVPLHWSDCCSVGARSLKHQARFAGMCLLFDPFLPIFNNFNSAKLEKNQICYLSSRINLHFGLEPLFTLIPFAYLEGKKPRDILEWALRRQPIDMFSYDPLTIPPISISFQKTSKALPSCQCSVAAKNAVFCANPPPPGRARSTECYFPPPPFLSTFKQF